MCLRNALNFVQLWFTLLCGGREVSISVPHIKSVEATTKFSGGRQYIRGPRMIVIRFDDQASGEENVCVIGVPNHEDWKKDILAAVENSKQGPF